MAGGLLGMSMGNAVFPSRCFALGLGLSPSHYVT